MKNYCGIDSAGLVLAKRAYGNGENVTERLRSSLEVSHNTSEIIEVAYDLQAGSYIEDALNNSEFNMSYAKECAAIINSYVGPSDSMLDAGTGELTTLSWLLQFLSKVPNEVYAFDVSWSRLFLGREYSKGVLGGDFDRLRLFVSEMGRIALHDKSIDVVVTSHSLEPNGGRLFGLLVELFRVARSKVFLFEPCYEINSPEGRERMDKLGYIKNVAGFIEEAGGRLVDRIVVRNVANPLNPTVCFVVDPPGSVDSHARPFGESVFSVPGGLGGLVEVDGFYFSSDVGVSYPVLKGIPVLTERSGILSTALCGV